MADRSKNDKKLNPNKTVFWYGLASMFNDVGANIIFPVWPFFITQVLGLSTVFLGMIDGLADFVQYVSKGISGLASDKLRKRKPFIWFGYFSSAIARLAYAFTTNAYALLTLRSVERFGKIRDAPRNALIADIMPEKRRGKAYGLIELFDKFGGVLGIFVLILIVAYMKPLNFTKVFIWAGLLSAISIIIVSFFTPEYFRRSQHYNTSIKFAVKENLKNPKFIYFLILAAIIGLASFNFSFVFLMIKPVFENWITGNGHSSLEIMILISALGFFVYNASASFAGYYFGNMSDYIGRKKSIFITNMIYFIALVFLYFSLRNTDFATKAVLLFLGFILYGINYGAQQTVLISYVSELVDKKYKATGIGIYYSIFGIATLLASLIAGYLIEFYSYNAMLMFSMVAVAIPSAMLFLDGKD